MYKILITSAQILKEKSSAGLYNYALPGMCCKPARERQGWIGARF